MVGRRIPGRPPVLLTSPVVEEIDALDMPEEGGSA